MLQSIAQMLFMPAQPSVADYLPWLSYDDDTKIFVLDGNYLGFGFTCLPLSGYETTIEQRFQALFTHEWPVGSYLQFNLTVFDDVSEHLAGLQDARSGSRDPLIQRATANTVAFVEQGARGVGVDIPIRNAGLIVSLKMPIKEALPTEDEAGLAVRLRRELGEILATVGFRELRPMSDDELLYQLSVVLNRDAMSGWRSGRFPTDPSRFLREQVLDFDKLVSIRRNHVRIGSHYVSSLSAKHLPDRSYFGIASRFSVDAITGTRGIPCSHMITVTVRIEDITTMRPQVERRRQVMRHWAEGNLGRIVSEYKVRKKDLDLMAESLADGQFAHRFSLNIMLFNPSEDEAEKSAMRVRTYLNEMGLTFFEDEGVVFNLLRANLPLGAEKEDLRNWGRYRLMNSSAIASFIPIFFEWRGTATPLMSLISRGGQVMGFDPFDSDTNYNLTISAESGAGKSFFANELISGALAAGGRVWVIDVGRSYLKLCETLGGQFLSFDATSEICLNPFSTVVTDDEFREVQDILLSLLATMAAPKEGLDDFQTAALRTILSEQHAIHRENLSVDDIAEACMERAKELAEGEQHEFREKRISDIGHGLAAFRRTGPYGRYFNGAANIDFSKPLVLLELEELKSQRHLQQVVLLLLIYHIQQGMYLGDRSTKKFMLVDEAWDLLSEGQTAAFIEAGYRRFRKYYGSACVITQSLMDLHDTAAGKAILANSANTIMLKQKESTLNRLAETSPAEYPRHLIDLLKTVHTKRGHYSEAFVRTSAGGGIGRFVVDKFRSLLYSTHPRDVGDIARYTAQGKPVEEAIEAVLEERHGPQRRQP